MSDYTDDSVDRAMERLFAYFVRPADALMPGFRATFVEAVGELRHGPDMTPADELVDKISLLLAEYTRRPVMNCPRCGLGMYGRDPRHYNCAHCRTHFKIDDDGSLVDRFACPCCGAKSDRADSFCSQACAESGADPDSPEGRAAIKRRLAWGGS